VAITSKSTQLTKEIRLYNSIVKYEDLKKLTDARDSQPNTVIEMESKTNPNEGPKDVKVLNPHDPTASEPTQPATQPEIGKQPETETEPAIGSQPEKETETPDVRGFRFIQIASKTIAKNLIQRDFPLLLLNVYFSPDRFVKSPH